MSYTLKHFKIPFFKNQLLNLVTLCHGFCISYRLAHVLSNFSNFNGFKYPMPKTINTASFHLLVLLQPLFSFGSHLCKCLLPNFKNFTVPRPYLY